jgi:hypothetical protein
VVGIPKYVQVGLHGLSNIFLLTCLNEMNKCIECGKCCKRHWLVKLSNKHEKKLFRGRIFLV